MELTSSKSGTGDHIWTRTVSLDTNCTMLYCKRMQERLDMKLHYGLKNSSGFFLLVVLLLSTLAQAAEPNDFTDFGDLDLAALLDATVESASSNQQSISTAPAVIEVIAAADLKAWGVSNLDEALARLPGVEVVENHWGYINVNIRGIVHPLFNNKILFLVDHKPLYEVGNMGFDTRWVPLNAIDRIEVIRGPGSVVFGTNAYAGVIHIFTRELDRKGGEAEAVGGIQAGAATVEPVPRSIGTGVRQTCMPRCRSCPSMKC